MQYSSVTHILDYVDLYTTLFQKGFEIELKPPKEYSVPKQHNRTKIWGSDLVLKGKRQTFKNEYMQVLGINTK